MARPSSVQKSFRVSKKTLDLLDATAESSGETRNSLVDRMLGEAVRTERHPLIRFRQGGSGRRWPALAGYRMYVHQLIAPLRASEWETAQVADDFGIEQLLVEAAVAYYSEFKSEIDELMASEERFAEDERRRWERQQEIAG